MQLDKVVIPAGLFNPARTYSLVRDNDGVYLIYTGRAMGNVAPSAGAAMAKPILNAIEGKRAVEIEAVEAKLRQDGARAMKDTKHSRFLPKASIKSVEIANQRVVVNADKKLKLHCFAHDPTTLREFFAPFMSAS